MVVTGMAAVLFYQLLIILFQTKAVLWHWLMLLIHAEIVLALGQCLELELSCSLNSALSVVHVHTATTLVRTTRETFGLGCFQDAELKNSQLATSN